MVERNWGSPRSVAANVGDLWHLSVRMGRWIWFAVGWLLQRSCGLWAGQLKRVTRPQQQQQQLTNHRLN